MDLPVTERRETVGRKRYGAKGRRKIRTSVLNVKP